MPIISVSRFVLENYDTLASARNLFLRFDNHCQLGNLEIINSDRKRNSEFKNHYRYKKKKI